MVSDVRSSSNVSYKTRSVYSEDSKPVVVHTYDPAFPPGRGVPAVTLIDTARFVLKCFCFFLLFTVFLASRVDIKREGTTPFCRWH